MHKFHAIAALRGDGLRPELQALFERLAIDPCFSVRDDGKTQAGPDPASETAVANVEQLRKRSASKSARPGAIIMNGRLQID
jgi:hypothetical protein